MWLAVYSVENWVETGVPDVRRLAGTLPLTRLCTVHPFLELATVQAEQPGKTITLQSFQKLTAEDCAAWRRSTGAAATTTGLTFTAAARLLEEAPQRRLRRASWPESAHLYLVDDSLAWSRHASDAYHPFLLDVTAADWEIVAPTESGPAGGR